VENIKRLVGEQIRHLRKEKGLSQEGLGWKSDIHYTYIGAIERGEKNWSIDTLCKIANGLGVGVNDLLNLSGQIQSEGESKALLIKEVKKCSPEVIRIVTDLIKAVEKQTLSGK
jgi:transcriptional regulator with XRE-family HTH domain